MNRDNAVSLIANRLGDRGDLIDTIVLEMQLAQSRLEGDPGVQTSWFLLSEMASATAFEGEERLPLPTDFIMEYEEGTLFFMDETGTPHRLEKGEWEVLKKFYPGTGAIPYAYAVVGNYFRLRPVPETAVPLRMLYYKQALPLTTDVENAWLKHAPDLLIAETGLAVATWIQNGEMVALFTRERDTARHRLMMENEARKHVNMDYELNPKHMELIR